jgi:hypothetical protein
VTDEVMLKKTADMPLVCIHPAGVGNGPGDPTGYSWVWNVVSGILIILIIIALTR